jgi:hypothetical protein
MIRTQAATQRASLAELLTKVLAGDKALAEKEVFVAPFSPDDKSSSVFEALMALGTQWNAAELLTVVLPNKIIDCARNSMPPVGVPTGRVKGAWQGSSKSRAYAAA